MKPWRHRGGARFVKQLGPGDAVGVFPLSPSRSRVDPQWMPRRAHGARPHYRPAVGAEQSVQPDTSKIIDIMAESNSRGTPLLWTGSGSRSSATSPDCRANALERVQVRECRQTNDPACVQAIVSEASALAQQLEERARESLIGLDGLLDALQQYPGRKTVVVVSGGMAVSDRPGGRIDIGDEAGGLGEQAARANAASTRCTSTPACRVPTRRRPAGSATSAHSARERTLSAKLLDEFAGRLGGALLPVNVGAGDIALSRVLRETSAYSCSASNRIQLIGTARRIDSVCASISAARRSGAGSGWCCRKPAGNGK